MSGKYVNGSQQALLAIVERLSSSPLEPLTVERIALSKPLAGELLSRDQVFRTLKNLELAGWAEQTPGGGWRLTPHVTQLAERFRVALADTYRLYLHASEDPDK